MKIIKSKKALEAEPTTLVTVIIIIVSIIISSGIITELRSGTESSQILESCRASIAKISLAKNITKTNIGFFKIDCPAPSFDYKTQTLRQDVQSIKTQIENCWYKTAGSSNRLGTVYWGFDSDICLVCSTFRVNKPIPTILIKNMINMSNRTVTSWDLNHIFLDMPEDAEDIYVAQSFKGHPFSKHPTELNELIPGTEYYVMSVNAANSRTPDFNMIFVIEEKNLEKIKCDGNAIFYQKI